MHSSGKGLQAWTTDPGSLRKLWKWRCHNRSPSRAGRPSLEALSDLRHGVQGALLLTHSAYVLFPKDLQGSQLQREPKQNTAMGVP